MAAATQSSYGNKVQALGMAWAACCAAWLDQAAVARAREYVVKTVADADRLQRPYIASMVVPRSPAIG